MKSVAFFVILFQIYSVFASQKIFGESCEKSSIFSGTSDSFSHKFLGFDSVVYELVNNLGDTSFESNRCIDELTLIKDGIHANDVWALKRKFESSLGSLGSLKVGSRPEITLSKISDFDPHHRHVIISWTPPPSKLLGAPKFCVESWGTVERRSPS